MIAAYIVVLSISILQNSRIDIILYLKNVTIKNVKTYITSGYPAHEQIAEAYEGQPNLTNLNIKPTTYFPDGNNSLYPKHRFNRNRSVHKHSSRREAGMVSVVGRRKSEWWCIEIAVTAREKREAFALWLQRRDQNLQGFNKTVLPIQANPQ
jgi:hypothetical protein